MCTAANLLGPLVLFTLLCVHGQDVAKPPVIINDLRGFDDSILFDIDWASDISVNPLYENEYRVKDALLNNGYTCAIPRLEAAETNSPPAKYTGRSPLDLISDLFTSAACSFRAESYWTYEVCHGDYIKQYHEEREGKTVKVQEYTLGRWTKKRTEELRERMAAAERRNEPVKYKKIEGLTLPYVELEMGDGTACGLIDNKPRRARVLYVCYAHGKNEVYSLKEVSTCQYEIIILTQALCEHPSYKPMAASENRIRCSPDAVGVAVQPKTAWPSTLSSLQKVIPNARDPDMEQFTKILAELGASMRGKFATIGSATKQPLAEGELDVDALSVGVPAATVGGGGGGGGGAAKVGRSPLADFISGSVCLTGGHGWWKYEFCYGRHVRQFHKHKNGGESSMMLGVFDAARHRAWLDAHPDKYPGNTMVAGRRWLSHYYDQGTMCELIGKPRTTEVRLKCSETSAGGGGGSSSGGTANQVQMYLLEPHTCQYVLSVESPLICDLFATIDEHGLQPSDTATKLEGGI